MQLLPATRINEFLLTLPQPDGVLPCGKGDSWITHHSNGEIVVDDAVWDRVPILLLVVGDHVNSPPVQHDLGAVLNVLQDLQQIATFITSGGENNSHGSLLTEEWQVQMGNGQCQQESGLGGGSGCRWEMQLHGL